jgi:hypothetical protein
MVLDHYGNVDGPSTNNLGKRCYTFVHHQCGTHQKWTFSNLRAQWKKRPGKTPCSKCGAQERQQKRMSAYMAVHGRNWTDVDYANWEAYNRSVRKLTELTYRLHKHIINPMGLPRGTRTFHLDHIVPVIKCFEDGWPVEEAAALSNLQLLEASANLKKGRSLTQAQPPGAGSTHQSPLTRSLVDYNQASSPRSYHER